MTENNHALQPALFRRRRTLIRWIAILAALGALAAVALGVARVAGRPAMTECERTYRRGEYQHAIDLCVSSYERTQSSADLIWAAESHLALGRYDEAGALAQRLIGGPHYGAGHKILSNVLLRATPAKLRDAKFHATAAVQAYARTKDSRGQVGASLALSQAAWSLGELDLALASADEVVSLARKLGDQGNEVAGHLQRVSVLQNMGDTVAVQEALERAKERARAPCDVAWTHYQIGIGEMGRRRDLLAKRAFGEAEEANRRCRNEVMSSSIELSMAWLERPQPARALGRLDKIKAAGEEGFESLLLRAYLAADRGALDEAAAYLAEAEAAEPPDADWLWTLETSRAELAELRGGPFDDLLAELYYRRAIELVSALRAQAASRSALLVASHRRPYDGLLSLYARAGRWRDALSVVLELDASDMLRSTAAGTASGLGSAFAAAPGAGRYERPPLPSIEDVLRAWTASERDLVIAIAGAPREIGHGRERVYRLRLVGGQLTGEDVGDANEVRTWVESLWTNPDHETAARVLGALLVPLGASTAILDVLAIGVLGKVPLGALRDARGALVLESRPLARVLALAPGGRRAGPSSPPVLLADPRGDLTHAATEGRYVRELLGGRARVSGSIADEPATLARLLEAKDAELLHIAGHVDPVGRWRVLRLQDSAVRPAEILRERIAPRLAVIAGCGSFASSDDEGWGSIATAFLGAGTSTVIATDRTVPDAPSLFLMRRFYSQPDWRDAPERALARAQREASETPEISAGEWAAYTVIRRPPDPAR